MIGFIADFFESDIRGGAEQNDSVLLDHLRKKHDIKELLSRECTIEKIKDCNFLIIGNFTHLEQEVKNYISSQKKYIIYEHDHKYIKTRDPSKFKDFKIPKSQIINEDFYRSAKKIVCLGKKQVEIINDCFDFNDDKCFSISTSLWSEEKLNYILNLQDSLKKSENFAIMNSQNPIKNTKKSVTFCEKNNLKYSLIHSVDHNDFLIKISECQGLVFFPGVLESMSRLVMEAKMLDCKIITTPRLLGAWYEPWFKKSGKELIKSVRQNVAVALQKFEELIE